VEPINSSLLTITLYSSVITTPVYNDTKYSVPFTTLYPISNAFYPPNSVTSCLLIYRTCITQLTRSRRKKAGNDKQYFSDELRALCSLTLWLPCPGICLQEEHLYREFYRNVEEAFRCCRRERQKLGNSFGAFAPSCLIIQGSVKNCEKNTYGINSISVTFL
jgi:hypothetical protein